MQIFDEIPERLFDFIKRSHLFFVATAPLEGGSVNVSPKSAMGAFELVHKNRVRYLDFTGSGNETISHLLQPGNGRITIMFVNIESGPPNIVRFYGKGSVHERLISGPESKFDEYVSADQPPPPGTRALIDIAIHTVTTSCGYSVPIYEYVKERQALVDWSNTMEGSTDMEKVEKRYKMKVPTEGFYTGKGFASKPAQRWIEAYWMWANALSIDGLPGMKSSQALAPEEERLETIRKKEMMDKLEPPKDDAGPFRASLVASPSDTTSTPIGSKDMTITKKDYAPLILAFTMGCALTASILLAPQFMNVSLL